MAGQMSNLIGAMTCQVTQLADTAANQAGRIFALVSNRVLTAIGTVESAAALTRIAAMVRVKTFHQAVDVVEEVMSGIIAGVGDEAITFPVELLRDKH